MVSLQGAGSALVIVGLFWMVPAAILWSSTLALVAGIVISAGFVLVGLGRDERDRGSDDDDGPGALGPDDLE